VDKRLAFQAILLAGLAATAVASLADGFLSLAWLAGFSVACLAAALFFSGEERAAAFALAALFTVLSGLMVFFTAFAGFILSAGIAFLLLFAGATVAAIALFFWLVLFKKTIPARAVGYSNGFAVVRVEPSLAHPVRAGVYAVRSKPVRKGAVVRVRVERRFFGPPSPVEVL